MFKFIIQLNILSVYFDNKVRYYICLVHHDYFILCELFSYYLFFVLTLKVPACVKILSYDHWNPPPSYRKLHGDLLYLQITTLEDRKFHATACTKGFFINLTTEEEFNPKPDPNFKTCHHSLVDLLSMISPAFKRSWSTVVKKRLTYYFISNKCHALLLLCQTT